MHFTEDMFEQAVIELFENMGYTHIYAPDIDHPFVANLEATTVVMIADILYKISSGQRSMISEITTRKLNSDTDVPTAWLHCA